MCCSDCMAMSKEISREIAAVAARMVVEEGLEYGPAKRRALRELGGRGRSGSRKNELPSNEQVEDEVRDYLAIFCADTQPAELQALRQVALGWMQRLLPFRPHLAGAVWRGTATRRSAVHIELYCDDPKSAEIAIVNLGVDFDLASLERQGADPATLFSMAAFNEMLGEHVTVHLSVLDHLDQRGALKPDARGRSWRGDLAALQRLMALATPPENAAEQLP